jgi:uncharacterized protein YciI
MFLVLLRFSTNKPQASQWMDGHKAWLQGGFDDGIFLLSGSLSAAGGGAILAHGLAREALEARMAADPFIVHDVVSAEIIEIAASRAESRLSFLLP